MLGVRIDGAMVPVEDTMWTFWNPAGNLVGARSVAYTGITAEKAMAWFMGSEREARRARRKGWEVQRVTKARWVAEGAPMLLGEEAAKTP
jgi:hypothetical protein